MSFKLKGEGLQGQQDLWLTKAEYSGLIHSVEDTERLVANNLKEGSYATVMCQTQFGMEKRVLIIPDHGEDKAVERFGHLAAMSILDICKDVMADKELSEAITTNGIIYDEELGEVVPVNEDGSLETIVCGFKENYILIFEAGDTYVRLKTLWNAASRPFKIYDDVVAIKKLNNGYVTDKAAMNELISNRRTDTP